MNVKDCEFLSREEEKESLCEGSVSQTEERNSEILLVLLLLVSRTSKTT